MIDLVNLCKDLIIAAAAVGLIGEAVQSGGCVTKNARQPVVRILRGIRPLLVSDKPEDIERFTIGPGPAGLEREAYYAGWLVVGEWLAHGMSFGETARIPEKEMPQRVGAEIDALLAATKR